jgi:hypothetical protein
MLVAIGVVALVCLVCLVWVIYAIGNAPEAWQDRDGFHLGRRK